MGVTPQKERAGADRVWPLTVMAFGQQGGEAQLAEVRCLMQTAGSERIAM